MSGATAAAAGIVAAVAMLGHLVSRSLRLLKACATPPVSHASPRPSSKSCGTRLFKVASSMNSGIAAFGTSLRNAERWGNGAAGTLRHLGIQARDSSGHIRPTGELINEVAVAMEHVENPMRRARIATQLLGGAARDLGHPRARPRRHRCPTFGADRARRRRVPLRPSRRRVGTPAKWTGCRWRRTRSAACWRWPCSPRSPGSRRRPRSWRVGGRA